MQANVLGVLKRCGGYDRRLARTASVAGVALVIASCSGVTSSPPAATSAGTSSPATSSPATSGSPAGHQVTVRMTDFHLALSDQNLTPGTYTFAAINAGHDEHAIEIDGPGVSDLRTPGVVEPGQSSSLTVTLQPGTYDIYCPVGDHRAMGMEVHVTVHSAGNSAPGSGGTTGGY
jgi:uncharacterized cupredoxin-like copper-binding protein